MDFTQFQTLLFNIPFAALQFLLTILSSWIAVRLKLKSPVVFCLTLPPIAGASALLVLGRGPELRNTLLGCYYVVRMPYIAFRDIPKFACPLARSYRSSVPSSQCCTHGPARTQPATRRSSAPQVRCYSRLELKFLTRLCTLATVFVAQCAGNVRFSP